MKDVKRTSNEYMIFHVISEPGDMTRYDYILFRVDNSDIYRAIRYNSTFDFPSDMEAWEARDIVEAANQVAAARRYVDSSAYKYVNPYTALEVARTIIEIEDGKWL